MIRIIKMILSGKIAQPRIDLLVIASIVLLLALMLFAAVEMRPRQVIVPDLKESEITETDFMLLEKGKAIQKHASVNLQGKINIGTEHKSIFKVREHEVVWGETLKDIAQRYQVDIFELIRLNSLRRPDLIVCGTIIKIPNKKR